MMVLNMKKLLFWKCQWTKHVRQIKVNKGRCVCVGFIHFAHSKVWKKHLGQTIAVEDLLFSQLQYLLEAITHTKTCMFVISAWKITVANFSPVKELWSGSCQRRRWGVELISQGEHKSDLISTTVTRFMSWNLISQNLISLRNLISPKVGFSLQSFCSKNGAHVQWTHLKSSKRGWIVFVGPMFWNYST